MKRISVLFLPIVCFGSANAVELYTGGSYSQNFDTLPISGATNSFANDSTLTGWFSLQSVQGFQAGRDTGSAWSAFTNIAGDTGTQSGKLSSYGSSGSAERALGGANSNISGDHVYAFVLQNTSGAAFSDFSLSFAGEQWRTNGTGPQKLLFDYEVLSAFSSSSSVAELRADNVANYIAVGNGDFTSLANTGAGSIMDGNLVNNRSLQTITSQPITWNNNEFLVLRWWDENEVVGSTSRNHGLAIDDFTFSATAAPVPEPASMAALGIGALTLIRRRKAAKR